MLSIKDEFEANLEKIGMRCNLRAGSDLYLKIETRGGTELHNVKAASIRITNGSVYVMFEHPITFVTKDDKECTSKYFIFVGGVSALRIEYDEVMGTHTDRFELHIV